jgi:hypothetical protein
METKNQHQEAISETNELLRLILAAINNPPAEKINWRDTPEICRMYNLSKRTIAHYRDSGLLPYSKLGGKVYYHLGDIENYLADHRTRKKQHS